jgi:hypothetical protein
VSVNRTIIPQALFQRFARSVVNFVDGLDCAMLTVFETLHDITNAMSPQNLFFKEEII